MFSQFNECHWTCMSGAMSPFSTLYSLCWYEGPKRMAFSFFVFFLLIFFLFIFASEAVQTRKAKYLLANETSSLHDEWRVNLSSVTVPWIQSCYIQHFRKPTSWLVNKSFSSHPMQQLMRKHARHFECAYTLTLCSHSLFH